MIINVNKANARVFLPINFVDNSVQEKYNKYLGSTEIDGQAYTDVIDWLSSSVKRVSFDGGLTMETISQSNYASRETIKKGSVSHDMKLWPRTATLTFAPLNGYLNWVCIIEECFRFHSAGGRKNTNIYPLYIRYYDVNDNRIAQFRMDFGIITNVSDLNFNYEDVDSEDDFTVQVSFSGVKLETFFEI